MMDDLWNATRRDLYLRAIRAYGHIAQWRQVQEECAELIAEVNRHLRGRGTGDDLASEIADAAIMVEQAMLLLGDETLVQSKLREKLARLKERLDAEDAG